MFKRLKRKFADAEARRDTLQVSASGTWHGRLYHFWRNNSEFKNTSSYTENLCHYVRVILFWGPLSVFLRLSPKRFPWITPATVTMMLLILSGFGFALFTNPFGTLGILGLLILCSVVGIGVFFLLSLLEQNKNEILFWWWEEGRGVKPLKTIGRVVSWPFKVLYDILNYKIFQVPVIAYVVVAGLVGCSIYSFEFFKIVGLTFLAGVAVLALGALIGVLHDPLADLMWRLSHRNRKPKKVKTKEEGFVSVGARYAFAKKGRICPFIEVTP